MILEEIVALAFAIADEAMLELLAGHAVRISPVLYGLVDENSQEVATLNAADPAIQDAFEWLSLRDFAELTTDKRGEVIRLKSDTAVIA